MATYRNLIHWAEEAGVELGGVEPVTLPGRGTGMVATRDLEVPS